MEDPLVKEIQVAKADQQVLVCVLPRIRIAGSTAGQSTFTISKASFLPDEPASWEEKIGIPRPAWLDIYRRFPGSGSDGPSEPARGTLIVSSDTHWLQEHAGRLIAITHFMDLNSWPPIPGEAFHYVLFNPKPTESGLVGLRTKNGLMIENVSSLHLLPPLELRGVSELFCIDLGRERHSELIRRFDHNPYDRLVTACYHFFRTTFDNPFLAPLEQDFAASCACLEAALDISGRNLKKQIASRLRAFYIDDPKMDRWVADLYAARSVFNHGISGRPSQNGGDNRLKSLEEFRLRKVKRHMLHELCYDVIHEQLQGSIDATTRLLCRQIRSAHQMLCRMFFSDELWQKVAQVFTQTQSVEEVLALSAAEEGEFLALCCKFLRSHGWEMTSATVKPKKVLNALKAMAAVFGEKAKETQSKEDIAAADELFQAAKTADVNAVVRWGSSHAAWECVVPQDVAEASKAFAVHTAWFFSVQHP